MAATRFAEEDPGEDAEEVEDGEEGAGHEGEAVPGGVERIREGAPADGLPGEIEGRDRGH